MPSEKDEAIGRFKRHEETEDDLGLLRRQRVCWVLDHKGKERAVPPEPPKESPDSEAKAQGPKVWKHS